MSKSSGNSSGGISSPSSWLMVAQVASSSAAPASPLLQQFLLRSRQSLFGIFAVSIAGVASAPMLTAPGQAIRPLSDSEPANPLRSAMEKAFPQSIAINTDQFLGSNVIPVHALLDADPQPGSRPVAVTRRRTYAPAAAAPLMPAASDYVARSPIFAPVTDVAVRPATVAVAAAATPEPALLPQSAQAQWIEKQESVEQGRQPEKMEMAVKGPTMPAAVERRSAVGTPEPIVTDGQTEGHAEATDKSASVTGNETRAWTRPAKTASAVDLGQVAQLPPPADTVPDAVRQDAAIATEAQPNAGVVAEKIADVLAIIDQPSGPAIGTSAPQPPAELVQDAAFATDAQPIAGIVPENIEDATAIVAQPSSQGPAPSALQTTLRAPIASPEQADASRHGNSIMLTLPQAGLSGPVVQRPVNKIVVSTTTEAAQRDRTRLKAGMAVLMPTAASPIKLRNVAQTSTAVQTSSASRGPDLRPAREAEQGPYAALMRAAAPDDVVLSIRLHSETEQAEAQLAANDLQTTQMAADSSVEGESPVASNAVTSTGFDTSEVTGEPANLLAGSSQMRGIDPAELARQAARGLADDQPLAISLSSRATPSPDAIFNSMTADDSRQDDVNVSGIASVASLDSILNRADTSATVMDEAATHTAQRGQAYAPVPELPSWVVMDREGRRLVQKDGRQKN